MGTKDAYEVLSVFLLVFGIISFFMGFHDVDLSLWSKVTGYSDKNLVGIMTMDELYSYGVMLEFIGVLSIILAYMLQAIYIAIIKQ